MLSSILGFLIFLFVSMGFCLFGAGCRGFFDWMENENWMENESALAFISRKFFRSLSSQVLVCSFGVAVLFVGIRYFLIPGIGVTPRWSLISLPLQFIIGWILMRRLQGHALEEIMSRREDHSKARGEDIVARGVNRLKALPWKPSEMRKITLPVSAQCFEKRSGRGFLPMLDWSLREGTTITIGPIEMVDWNGSRLEVVPFSYNGFLYYLRIRDIRIDGLGERLRTRSNFSVVK